MRINGFLKTTLLDYPNQVASTVFCGSCNFRCPFCHNSDLVLSPEKIPEIPEEEIFAHLNKRKNILDGVCITGGEPTLQADLRDLIRKIKDLGLKVKLDTNGYRPHILKSLCEEGLIDYVAMDIKQSRDKYNSIANISGFDISRIDESVKFLMSGHIPYEFRTTVVRQLHAPSDIIDISKWLAGAEAYYIQNFKSSENVLSQGLSDYSAPELQNILAEVQRYIPNASLRGVD